MRCGAPAVRRFSACPSAWRAPAVWESKRMDSFKEIHEALKKKADNEKEFLKSILKVMDEDEEDEGISSNATRDL